MRASPPLPPPPPPPPPECEPPPNDWPPPTRASAPGARARTRSNATRSARLMPFLLSRRGPGALYVLALAAEKRAAPELVPAPVVEDRPAALAGDEVGLRAVHGGVAVSAPWLAVDSGEGEPLAAKDRDLEVDAVERTRRRGEEVEEAHVV